MSNVNPRTSTRNSLFIRAPQQVLYRAFTDPAARADWFAPGEMTAEVHNFDLRVGGGYQMSLYYPAAENFSRGKRPRGKIDILPGLWSSSHPEKSPPRSPLIQPIHPS